MRPFWVVLLLSADLVYPAIVMASSRENAPRVCVATVGNASAVSVMMERLTSRLTQNLSKSKIDSISMDSSTTLEGKLLPTLDNGEEARSKECDYILLTQIRENRSHPGHLAAPEISIGGRVPSIDASDPLGGSSGPVYRENMQVNFALFRTGRPDPMLDTYLLERSSANVSESFLGAMDRESNRVSHDLKKSLRGKK